MTRMLHVALMLGATSLALAACQSADQGGATAQSAGQAPGLSKADATFIDTAGPLVVAEVRFAQLAATKAANPSVRDFASKLLADHTMIDQQLAALAQGNGMLPPSDMDGRHQGLYQQLQSLAGPAFDHAYMNDQMQDLTMVIQAFQAESDSGKDPQVRNFARQYLPVTQQHLQAALALAAAGI